ncbi:Ferredoxin--sulfite reductase [Prochlorococcus marinus str. PAC1]|uniref:Ferredoxin--sulfite reductase n=2 Tax=Prochlorococcus marinus TaxID=1219 RepID=A0A0A2BZU9_PROMR|nr:Ferredoxin--sulfite reductase [Prochlorococcus marinus str. PAC1]
MPKIIEIPGRSGFYLRVAVPRGKLRDAFGTCDVVKKIGNTKEEAEENISSAEIAIQQKFDEKLREEEAKQINKSLPREIRLEAIKNSNSKESPKNIEKDLKDAGFSNAAIDALMNFDENEITNREQIEQTVPSPCIANNSPRAKFEQFKADSNYLKEPLQSELSNDSDHFTNDAVQLLKFHGSYQQDDREHRKKGGTGKDWQMMLRLRNPAGYVPGPLFVALDELSDRLGNQTLRATTRQCFQMHGIKKGNIKEVIGTIVKSMGSTLAACGDVNRNVMAPAAPYEKGSYPAARKLANDIADVLSPQKAEKTYIDLWVDGEMKYAIKPSSEVKKNRKLQLKSGVFSGDKKEPLYGATYLPRKFKCATTVPGDNSVDILTHDIGLVTFTNKKGVLEGCNVYVGGGMGRTHNLDTTFARTADPIGYVEGEYILELVQSILALQRDYGDRKTRRHSRLKYVLHDMGVDWFKNQLTTKYFRRQIENLKHEGDTILEDYLGWHQQSEKLWFVGLPLLSGRLTGKVKKELRNIVEKYALDVRLTPNQDLLLCNIGNYQKASVKKELINVGFINPGTPNPLARHAIACPALPLCGLAMTEAERFLPELLERINNQLKILNINKSILIRVTGCPNGCARPYMAELALVGSGLNQYQLWLGGSTNLKRLATPYLQKMPIDELEKTLEPLFLSWKDTGTSSSLGDHVTKLGSENVMSLLTSSAAP